MAAIPILFLLIEDSAQDYHDVGEYVREQCILADLEEGSHYTIDRAITSDEATEKIAKYEPLRLATKLFVISDLHLERGDNKGDFDEIVRSFILANKEDWREQVPIIIYSQYASQLDKELRKDPKVRKTVRNRNHCTFILKAQRGLEDDRDLLRKAIKSGIMYLKGDESK